MTCKLEVDILTNILASNGSVDNVMMVLQSIPPSSQSAELDALVASKIKQLVEEDDKAEYNRLLASMLLYTQSVDHLDAQAAYDAYVATFNVFLSFLADYPSMLIVLVKVMNRHAKIRANTALCSKLLDTIDKYTAVAFFHDKVSKTVFNNIEDDLAREPLAVVKELLGVFASLVVFSAKNKEDSPEIKSGYLQVVRNLFSLIEHPVSETHKDLFSACVTKNKNEAKFRLNCLYTYLIDTFQYLNSELRVFADVHASMESLSKKLVAERGSVFAGFSEVNLMKVILDYFEQTEKRSEYFEWLKQSETFERLLEVLLWSKDSEDLKYSFHFMQQTLSLVQDKDLRKLWSDCVNLLSTLDAYGKHLIEPQWDGIIKPLLQHLSKQDEKQQQRLDLFWMFNVLAKKALQHENPTVIKIIIGHIFEQNLNLDVYHNLFFQGIVPFLDNAKLFDEIGEAVDIHPRLATFLRDFVARASKGYPHVFADHFELLARQILKTEAFHARATVWHAYGALYRNGVRSKPLPAALLDAVVARAVETAQCFPPFRKSIFIEDFISFFGCLELDLECWQIVTKFFLADAIQDVYFHHLNEHLRDLHLKILVGNAPLLQQVLHEVEGCSKDLLKILLKADPKSHAFLWTIKLLFERNVHLDPTFAQVFSQAIIPQLTEGLEYCFQEVDRMNNNPYVIYADLNQLAVLSMHLVYSCLKFFKPILSRTDNLKIVLTGIVTSAEHNFEARDTAEEFLYLIRSYLSETSHPHLDTVKRVVGSASQALVKYLSEPYTKEAETREREKSYKADVHLTVVCSLVSWLIEKGVGLAEEELAGLMQLYAFITKPKAGIRLQPVLRSSFELFVEFLQRDSLINEAKVKEYLEDCSHLVVVNKFTRLAINKIYSSVLLPLVKPGSPLVDKYFKTAMDSIIRNRNTLIAYYMYESFLVVALEELCPETAEYICDRLIEVCEIDHAAFRLRRTATLVCRLMTTAPAKLINVVKLVEYLLIKEELRPRDATFVVDIREFVHRHGMSAELAQEMNTLNAYNGFPRILVNAFLERVVHRADSFDEATQASLDKCIAQIFDSFIFGYFKEGNNKTMKPFDDKHKVLLRKLQCLVVLSTYMRNCKPRLPSEAAQGS